MDLVTPPVEPRPPWRGSLAAGATLLAGLGLAGITAAPASAAAHWCNKTMGDFINGGNGHELAQTPAYNSTFVQADLRLEDNGVYGPKTRAKLSWRSSTGHCATLP